MTPQQLTVWLAENVMGWRASGDRYLTGNREWKPRWRFQPAKNLADALHLLQKAGPEDYAVNSEGNGMFRARVRLGARVGVATDKSQARAITFALARALGIEVDVGLEVQL